MGTASFPKNCLFSGDYSIGETPVPIPNTEVKPYCADGTALETGWESRSLPGIIHKTLELTFRGLVFYRCKKMNLVVTCSIISLNWLKGIEKNA